MAAVPVLRKGRVPRALTSFDTPHHPYWLFPLAPNAPEAAAAIIEYMLGRSEVVVLRRIHPQSRFCTSLVEAAEGMGLDVLLTQAHIADAFVELRESWEEFRKTLSKNIVNDVPRKLRNLQKLGRVEFDIVSSGPSLRPILNECLELETKGWKGARGEPIITDPRTHRFYTSLAKAMGARNRFALYTLRLDGRIIAFEYCLRHRGRIDMLKLSFDPDLSRLSPGSALRWMLFQHEITKNEVRSYHLGNPRRSEHGPNWKLRWATKVEPLADLYIYNRGALAKLAYLGGPLLRERMKKTRAGEWIKSALRRKNERL